MADQMNAPVERGRVIVIATLAVAAIFVLSQVTYPPALKFVPTPDVTPVPGVAKTPKIPLLKRINPLRKRPDHERNQIPAPGPAARTSDLEPRPRRRTSRGDRDPSWS